MCGDDVIMKCIRSIIVWTGLILWVTTGVIVLYRYAILEKYQVGHSGSQSVLIRNSLTGYEELCTAGGCFESYLHEKNKTKKVTLIPLDD